MRHIRVHGDNIIECERSLSLLSMSLNTEPQYIETSKPYMPTYQLGNIQVDLLSGHGRWGINIADILAMNGGVLREGADSYITEVIDGIETILFAIEYCSALPAGNNAWQRNGRALSCALSGVPYFYIAEIGGVELDEHREVKAPRFPNPVVPFSYLTASKSLHSLCLPIYTAHPAITDNLYQKYSNVFGLDDCLRMIEAILNGCDYTPIATALTSKALNMVKLLANNRRAIDTLRDSEWDKLLKSCNRAKWLDKNFSTQIWKKKKADKIRTTNSFENLFDEVTSYNCLTIGAKDLPICIIPNDKRNEFEAYLKKTYPTQQFSFNKCKPIAIVWITGFKPQGDDSRPDRGLAPLAKMILGNDTQTIAVVYGPAKQHTWNVFKDSPQKLAQDNGLWQSILYLCDYVLIDSTTNSDKIIYKTNSKLTRNNKPIRFNYTEPSVDFTENDIDTSIHQLFSRKEHLHIYESSCNPPGGDWSGISYFKDCNEEYRWTSLPRVSAVGGKRPDHIIQIQNHNTDIFLSIESKLRGSDLETNIGTSLKTYIDELFKNSPNAYKTAQKDWRLYDQTNLHMRPYKIISVGAYKFDNIDNMRKQLQRGNLDAVLAFEFAQTTTLHVMQNKKHNIVDILNQVQMGLKGLKIQVD